MNWYKLFLPIKRFISSQIRYKLCQPDFACEADALKALAHFENTLKMTSILDRQVNALAHYSKPSRPPRDQKPERYHYRI
jgi:hypothetical protein